MSDSDDEYDRKRSNTYDIEIPQALVGLVIGIKGKTIKKVSHEASVHIHVRQHHDETKAEAFQIFEIRGPKYNIGIALRILRDEFPIERFPELSLKRVVHQYIQLPTVPYDRLRYLSLPLNGLFDIHISSVVDINHFFVQLPSHPTFKSLYKFDEYLSELYCNSPEPDKFIITPKSFENLMCVAPLDDKWYRAVALKLNIFSKQMFVKFVDYGGFSHIPQDTLRFIIRQDVMELPFQAIECRLADIQPLTAGIWTNQAKICFQNICMKKILKAKLVGHHYNDGLPYIRIFIKNKNNQLIRFDEYFVKQKHAKPWDASSCVFLDGSTVLPKKTFAESVENKNQKR